jgi:BCD family chlorophyll transporter-like MFS transporter
MNGAAPLGWFDIVRVALVQTSLGAIVVLTTSTMNRVMVVELALPAMLPGVLVALHYAVQMLRPRLGHGSDEGGRRTPWIVGGMLVLAAGGVLAALATALMATSGPAGVALATLAFLLIGLGVGAAGTSLLVLVAKRVAPERRAPAATLMWTMMIAGFAITASVAGHFLDPFSPARLVAVTVIVSSVAFLLSVLAVVGIEGSPEIAPRPPARSQPAVPFRVALAEVWREAEARAFTIFVFVSMLAYSTQDLILEPFAGIVFGMTPGESTRLAGLQNAAVLCGMLLVAVAAGTPRGRAIVSLRIWTIVGCVASALSLAGLVLVGGSAEPTALRLCVMALGVSNGAFAIAAVASMMELAAAGRARREGVRIGLWGAAQAIAFALGGFLGAVGVDVLRAVLDQPVVAYATVFAVEAMLFLLAAVLAARVAHRRSTPHGRPFAAALHGAGGGA